jgi:hypothetical protein
MYKGNHNYGKGYGLRGMGYGAKKSKTHLTFLIFGGLKFDNYGKFHFQF